MSKITKLVLLCMLTAVSLPSTAQQLIDLQGNSTLKTSQPAVADISDVYGNKKLSVSVDSRLSSVTTDTGGLKPGIYIATMIVDGNIVNSIKFTVS